MVGVAGPEMEERGELHDTHKRCFEEMGKNKQLMPKTVI